MAKITSARNRSKQTASKRPTSSETRATRSKASTNSTTKLSQSGGGTKGSARITSSGGKTVARTTTRQGTLNLSGKAGGMKPGAPSSTLPPAKATAPAKGPATRQGSLDLKGSRFKARPAVPAAVAAAARGTTGGAFRLGKAGAMGLAAAVGLNAGRVADGTLKGKPVKAPAKAPSSKEQATASNFEKSFKKARSAGSKVFMWKGKKYNTKRKDGK